MTSKLLLHALLLLPCLAFLQHGVGAQDPFLPTGLYVVDIRPASETEKLAVRACAGLFNRQSVAGNVYILERDEDEGWLEDTTTQNYTSIWAAEFLPTCFLNRDIVKGAILYSYTVQQEILPNIITLAGVLDAIPIDENDVAAFNLEFSDPGNPDVEASSTALRGADNSTNLLDSPIDFGDSATDSISLQLVFDALRKFRGFSALQATRFVFNNYGQQTTTMAKINPGYEPSEGVEPVPEEFGLGELQPQLVGRAELGLADFVVKEKLFAFFLWFGCVQGTDEEGLFSRMTNPLNNNWPNPIPVYGYDNSFTIFEGDIFEANTNCGNHRNSGTIPTRDVVNLSFFSRDQPSTRPTQPIPASQELGYDSSKTYIAFMIGDGDNLEFVKRTRREWMQERVRYCSEEGNECYPVIWSMSPHVVTLTPDWWKWYQDQARLATNGKDTFALPPSGHLYSYPTLMRPADQSEFVRLTEEGARNLNSNTLTAWEITGTWFNAFTEYLPRYLQNGIIQAALAINVPYLVPIVEPPFTSTYRILQNNGNQLAVFQPFLWRGTDGRDPAEYHRSTNEMAKYLNDYPKGALNFVYTSSDGGFTISDIHKLMPKLADHVQVVDSQQLASLAFQRGNPGALDLLNLVDPIGDVVENLSGPIGDVVEDLSGPIGDVVQNLPRPPGGLPNPFDFFGF